MDISIGNQYAGRIVFGLYSDIAARPDSARLGRGSFFSGRCVACHAFLRIQRSFRGERSWRSWKNQKVSLPSSYLELSGHGRMIRFGLWICVCVQVCLLQPRHPKMELSVGPKLGQSCFKTVNPSKPYSVRFVDIHFRDNTGSHACILDFRYIYIYIYVFSV